jgi:hypothetical protein
LIEFFIFSPLSFTSQNISHKVLFLVSMDS